MKTRRFEDHAAERMARLDEKIKNIQSKGCSTGAFYKTDIL